MNSHDQLEMKLQACIGIGSCVTGFVVSSLPYLQFTALVISIVAGLRALWIAHKAARDKDRKAS